VIAKYCWRGACAGLFLAKNAAVLAAEEGPGDIFPDRAGQDDRAVSAPRAGRDRCGGFGLICAQVSEKKVRPRQFYHLRIKLGGGGARGGGRQYRPWAGPPRPKAGRDGS